MNERIDFTACQRVPGKAYNGANGKKIAVIYNNEQYMLKFPPSADGKPTELSYTNSCVSEHISCSIFNMLGLNAQKTLLGIYNVNGKEKLVCACKDFTVSGSLLYDFCSIKNTIIDSEHNGSGTDLWDILETIDKQQFVDPLTLQEHFWNVFVVDAFLGNFDRHNGNWGFLYNEETNSTQIAPIFDCGSCLLPQADEQTMQMVLQEPQQLDARVYQFPNSAIKLDGRKINYSQFLMSGKFDGCNQALERIVPKIDMQKIVSFIEFIPYLTDLQKEFYSRYITARYEKIIEPAYENVMGLNQEYEADYDESEDFEMTM